jgi:hypothetical protein
MKQLSRDEMKNLNGGFYGSVLTGTQLVNGQCRCDYHVTWSNGAYADLCGVNCGMSNCQALQ